MALSVIIRSVARPRRLTWRHFYRPRHTQAASAHSNAAAQVSDRQNTTRAATKDQASTTLVDSAVDQASKWAAIPQKESLVIELANNPSAVSFVTKFIDSVMRPESPSVAAAMLKRLVSTQPVPSFMSSVDNALLQTGSTVAPFIPSVVVNSAKNRMRSLVAPFIDTIENSDFKNSSNVNINLLAEGAVSEAAALRRRKQAEEILDRAGCNYVSLKVTGLSPPLNNWDYQGSLNSIVESIRPIFTKAAGSDPKRFINIDVEKYCDREITMEAFTRLLSEPQFQDLDAGIVVQSYLPNSFSALQNLVAWAHERPGRGEIKIRLVKGANLATEKVDAAMRGWEQAPYELKSDADANYLRCLDWVLTSERLQRVRIGVASHNLFYLGYAKHLSDERGVSARVSFENIKGMTPSHTPALAEEGMGMLLYTPVCRNDDFGTSISYLFRRFEEISSPGNFLNSLPSISAATPSFKLEETRFRSAYAKKDFVSTEPRRKQERPAKASHMTLSGLSGTGSFLNEPDSDPSIPHVRDWALRVMDKSHFQPVSESSWVKNVQDMDMVLNRARDAAKRWRETEKSERQELIARIGDVIARRRGDFLNAIVHEGSKTFHEGDIEMSEAVDFANYYSTMTGNLPDSFESFGVVTVAAPWNFPSAIGMGGTLASLAAGNAVIVKPSPNTPRCLELGVECAWEAGVPRDVLQFVQCPENEVGKHLITGSDAVILTGSTESAKLFRSWKNDIKLFAEVRCLFFNQYFSLANLSKAPFSQIPDTVSNTLFLKPNWAYGLLNTICESDVR